MKALTSLLVELPVRVTNPLNSAGWSKPRVAQIAEAAGHAKQKKLAHQAVAAALARRGIRGPELARVVVTFTRIAAGKIDRHDGLSASFKWCCDGVALALGIDDGDDRIAWRYERRFCARGQYGVEILIQPFERDDHDVERTGDATRPTR